MGHGGCSRFTANGPLTMALRYARWGGTVVYHEGQYHMISAEMADRCSLGVWTYKSQV